VSMLSTRSGLGRPAGSHRGAATLLVLAAATVGAWRLAVLAAHWRQAAYAMPPGVLVVGSAALAVIAVAGVVTARSGRVDAALLSIVATFLLGYGFLAIFSIGLPILGLGALATILLVRRLSSGSHTSLIISAPALAIALVCLVGLAADLPVVACQPGGGVVTGFPVWLWVGGGGGGEAGSSGSSSSGPGSSGSVSSGTVTIGSSTYEFRCAGGHLATFGSR
jgi:hypothetical protein